MSYSVVVVDDEPRICSRLKLVIPWEDHGFTLAGTFEKGEDVIDILWNDPPDLLISDIYMDSCSGIDLARLIDQNGIPTKVVFISGYRDVDLAMSAINYHAAGYILKPIDPALLISTLDYVRDMLNRERTGQTVVSGSGTVFSEQVKAYVHDHLNEDISLDMTAKAFFMSPGHFSRSFKQTVGKNFISFVTSCRMERAMVLLRQPSASIASVAEAVGYHIPRYFSEVFREYTGITPSDYRKQNCLPAPNESEDAP